MPQERIRLFLSAVFARIYQWGASPFPCALSATGYGASAVPNPLYRCRELNRRVVSDELLVRLQGPVCQDGRSAVTAPRNTQFGRGSNAISYLPIEITALAGLLAEPSPQPGVGQFPFLSVNARNPRMRLKTL